MNGWEFNPYPHIYAHIQISILILSPSLANEIIVVVIVNPVQLVSFIHIVTHAKRHNLNS